MKKTLALLLLLAGLSAEAQAEALTWNGSEDHMTWNTEDTNWLQGETDVQYTDNSDVVFGDNGSGVVTLAGNLAPASVTVNSGNDYTFAGNGSLTGEMQLTKEGAGTLTINTANDYSGGTTISGGTLGLGNPNALGSGKVTLKQRATLDLGNHTISNSVEVDGSNSIIDNGTIDGNINVAEEQGLIIGPLTTITGEITLQENSRLDLGGRLSEAFHLGGEAGNRITLAGTSASIDNGILTTGERERLTITADLKGTSTILMSNFTILDLNNHTLSNNVTVKGKSDITTGTFNGNLTVGKDATLILTGDLKGSGVISLSDSGCLELDNHTLNNSVHIKGSSANFGGGTLTGDLTLDAGTALYMPGSLKCTANITLGDKASLDFGKCTLTGTIHLGTGASIVGEATSIKNHNEADSALLEKVSVSNGLIAGTGRSSSLADGLCIQSWTNLMIENMSITANNEISVVGDQVITLKDVTIKLSQAHYDETEGVFHFNLGSLINCDLVMENVLMDASDLTLPQGFDPANKSVVFDFGDDVTIRQATGLDMRLGNYWSTSLNLDQPGKVIFTKLVPTPEPTTGVLSLLGLGLLVGRRRK